jgi:glycerophosphoryl diester phosphodiesterase
MERRIYPAEAQRSVRSCRINPAFGGSVRIRPAKPALACLIAGYFARMPQMKFAGYLLLLAIPLLARAAEIPLSKHVLIVIAHRGNHRHAHENTLTALQNAINAGADYAEIDVRRTSDGHHVLMHDQTVDRMTDGHGSVKQLTLSQLQQLHVRDLRRPEIAADRIPTFEDALQLIKGRVNIYLDFKEGDRLAVTKAIRNAGVGRQILVYDDIEAAPEWRRVAPELPLIVTPPDDLKTPQQLVEFAKRHQIEILDGSWETYSREMIESAERAGVKVWPDIQAREENADFFDKVLRLGFTGVQTDHPEELIAWLKERHLR